MITETSRIHQAMLIKTHVGTGVDLINKVGAEHGVSIDMFADEINSVLTQMTESQIAASANWYFEAHNYAAQLAVTHNVSVEVAAGIISAVSPRMPWLRNKRIADSILEQFRNYDNLSALEAAKAIGLALSTNVAMTIRIARGESIETVLSGTKRRSFYNNIVNPFAGDSVTIDTWMIEAYVKLTGSTKKAGESFVRASRHSLNDTGVGYFILSEAVRKVAIKYGMFAHQIQACYWVAMAGSMNGGRTDIG